VDDTFRPLSLLFLKVWAQIWSTFVLRINSFNTLHNTYNIAHEIGTGWPSFWKPVDKEHILEITGETYSLSGPEDSVVLLLLTSGRHIKYDSLFQLQKAAIALTRLSCKKKGCLSAEGLEDASLCPYFNDEHPNQKAKQRSAALHNLDECYQILLWSCLLLHRHQHPDDAQDRGCGRQGWKPLRGECLYCLFNFIVRGMETLFVALFVCKVL